MLCEYRTNIKLEGRTDVSRKDAFILIEKAQEAAKSLIDCQPTAIEGKVKEAEYTYQRSVSIKPKEHHYEELGEKPYIKYSCPVCEAFGNLHQVTLVIQNCPVCGIQLYWG